LKDKILSGEKKQTIRPYSEYWLKFKKGDRLVGYWKMRTPNNEKLFDSVFSEDPFWLDITEFDDELMKRDGFENLKDGLDNWFGPKYDYPVHMPFVVIRWE